MPLSADHWFPSLVILTDSKPYLKVIQISTQSVPSYKLTFLCLQHSTLVPQSGHPDRFQAIPESNSNQYSISTKLTNLLSCVFNTVQQLIIFCHRPLVPSLVILTDSKPYLKVIQISTQSVPSYKLTFLCLQHSTWLPQYMASTQYMAPTQVPYSCHPESISN